MIYFIKESTYSTLNLYSPTLSPNNEIPKENFPYQSPYHSSPEDNEAASYSVLGYSLLTYGHNNPAIQCDHLRAPVPLTEDRLASGDSKSHHCH